MKPLHILLTVLLLNGKIISAQVLDVVTNLDTPEKMVIVGDMLYFTGADDTKIFKFDITETNPVVTTVVTAVSSNTILGLAHKDSFLFFSQKDVTDIASGGGNISKIDITVSVPTITNEINTFFYPADLIIHGDNLYMEFPEQNKVSWVDLTTTHSAFVTIHELGAGVSVGGFAFKGNELYIADPEADKIVKIDVTAVDPGFVDVLNTGLSNPKGVAFKDDELYIADTDNDRIIKIDVTDATPEKTDVLIGLSKPQSILFKGDDLYFIQKETNRVSKFNITNTLTKKDVKYKTICYPNPTSNNIKIIGLKKTEPYKIYDLLGHILQMGIVKKDDKINLQNLTKGLYLLKLGKKKTIKLIKE
ncbi:T9SS type A sorting domain-containing protein [Tamlana sp. 2201CG12-4]|uniref:T9SS type A sorting domain-containing protein n=1 Tax=Tamlana sp. 2201CG12-4 TaxID=3112582 RepID=UPI002DB95954|nr:T9SS type A sorting domain-containing protein [Tamlana sp. 2201CG12-4]MEC3906035.1 T9SS type A sorting domain-containing protein [Tamlana sp. 2201CG12-4]